MGESVWRRMFGRGCLSEKLREIWGNPEQIWGKSGVGFARKAEMKSRGKSGMKFRVESGGRAEKKSEVKSGRNLRRNPGWNPEENQRRNPERNLE